MKPYDSSQGASFDDYKIFLLDKLNDHSARMEAANQRMEKITEQLNAAVTRMAVIETDIKTRTWITSTAISVIGSGLMSTVWALLFRAK